MRWRVKVLQMSDGWARKLKWHLDVTKLQKMRFGLSDTFSLKTVPEALKDDKERPVLEEL
jgi:hypothetical protein